MRNSFSYIARLCFVALLFSIAPDATAQSSVRDSRWAPWIGCWQPVLRAEGSAASSIICVAPSGANAVEVATIDSGKVMSRDTIDASGTQTPIASQGCSGWRSGEWSGDGRRVYLHSELTCSGNIKRTSTGLLAFTERYGWLDVQTVRSGKSQGTRSSRYTVAEPSSVGPVPAELAGILRAGTTFDNVARMLAGSEVKPDDVVDASTHVDAAVVEVWLSERGQPFKLDGKTLAKLADAGVPGSVTDVMIGVTYTDRFALSRGSQAPSTRASGGGVGGGSAGSAGYVFLDANGCEMQTYRTLYYDGCYRGGYGYVYPYDYGYGFGGYYGYGSYGYRTPIYSDYTSGPVVIVDRNKQLPHGTLVNGYGYTRGSAPDGGSSSGSSGSPPTTGKSSSGSTTGSGSSSGGGRTAHKKGG